MKKKMLFEFLLYIIVYGICFNFPVLDLQYLSARRQRSRQYDRTHLAESLAGQDRRCITFLAISRTELVLRRDLESGAAGRT